MKMTNNQWVYEIPKVNNGKETIDEMSLITGLYEDFILTKTGYLVGLIEVSGINVDLMSEIEQEDVFDSYNAYLKSSGACLQTIEVTLPVNMSDYIMNLKKRYLTLKSDSKSNLFLINLIASYIDTYSALQANKAMSTKKHIVQVRVKIKDKSLEELVIAKSQLLEDIEGHIRSLEDVFADFDLTAKQLLGHEVQAILKNLINFKS